MKIIERLRPMRKCEGLTQREISDMTEIVLGTYKNYEQGERDSMTSTELEKITTHPRFQKYALWLTTGLTAPESGQISPELEIERRATM